MGSVEPEQLSLGESFLEVLRTRFDSPSLYCLDAPGRYLRHVLDRDRSPDRVTPGRRRGV